MQASVFSFNVGPSEKKDLPYTTDLNIDICTVGQPVPKLYSHVHFFLIEAILPVFIHEHIIRGTAILVEGSPEIKRALEILNEGYTI